MHLEAERAAVSERVDLRLRASFSGERVVWRNASIVSDSEDLAALVTGILREVRILRRAASGGDVEHAVLAERDARRAGGIEDEDVFDVGERLAVEASARDGDGAALLVERFRVGEIQELVLGELWMQCDVHVAVNGAGQTRLTGEVALWSAGNRVRIEHAIAHDAEIPGALGDEQGAVRRERKRPRELQPFRHHD